jgi:predicted PurR-regulated permease PerM
MKDVTPYPRPNSNPFAASVRVLGLYIRAAVLIFVIQIVLYSAGFAVAQLPWWGFMAVVCAVLGLIPHIGSLLGIGFVLLISSLAGTDVLHLAIAAAVWVLVQAIEGFWLTPRLIGKPLGLRPLVVFFAILAGSLAFGPLGLFLAVPVLAVAMVWVRYFRGSKPPALPASPPLPSVRNFAPPTTGIDPYKDK